MCQDENELYYQNEAWRDGSGDWWDYQSYYSYGEDDWWQDDWEAPEQASMPVANAVTEEPAEDPALREAQQAEKIAESLALDAQRTWAEAQKATQALRVWCSDVIYQSSGEVVLQLWWSSLYS